MSAAPEQQGETELTSGRVYTFYSYKGGVGRSMTLANVAALLAMWGKRVLILDWDLEAPGIERYFEKWMSGPSRRDTPGLIDLVEAFERGEPLEWQTALLQARLSAAAQVSILSSGRDDSDYTTRLQRMNWERLFEAHDFGAYLERLRNEWVRDYDFVLVDSRTGITDIGGICTIHLPDVVLALFTASHQSLAGVKDVMQRARRAHADLPVDRRRLLVVPLPARDESASEYNLAKQWRERFAAELAEFLRDWVPTEEKSEEVFNRLKIPYFPYWSFGEQLPVMEEDPENPKTLAFSYQLVGRLLLGNLDWREVKQGTAATEAVAAQSVKVAELNLEAARVRTEAQRAAAEQKASLLEDQRARFIKTRYEPGLAKLEALAQRAASSRSRIGWSVLALLFFLILLLFCVGTTGKENELQGFLVLAVLANVVAIAILIGRFSNAWRRKSVALSGSSALRRERSLFEGGSDRYLGLEPVEALHLFLSTTEKILFTAEAGEKQNKETARNPPALPTPATLPPPSAAELFARIATSGTGPAASRPKIPPGLPVSPTEAVPAVAPPIVLRDPEVRYDIFISYRSNPITNAWLAEFVPLLSSWIAMQTDEVPKIFFDASPGQSGSEALQETTATALASARCLVAIVTPAYGKSSPCLRELEQFSARRSSGIFPVLVQKTDPLPDLIRSSKYADFREYFFTGGGFTQSALYVDFQKSVRQLAEEVAAQLSASENAETTLDPIKA